jgi:hypothetical protein
VPTVRASIRPSDVRERDVANHTYLFSLPTAQTCQDESYDHITTHLASATRILPKASPALLGLLHHRPSAYETRRPVSGRTMRGHGRVQKLERTRGVSGRILLTLLSN